MPGYHLAQLNIADLKFPLDTPELAGFVDNLDVLHRKQAFPAPAQPATNKA